MTMFETNYTMPKNLEVLASTKIDVEKAVVALNKAIDDKKDMATVKNLEKNAKDALKALNGKIAEQWVNEISEFDTETATKTYINAAGELGAFRLKNPSGETIHYEVVSTKRALSFRTFEKAVKCASSSVYNTMVERFLHNISLNLSSKTEGIGANTLTNYMDKEQAGKAGSDFAGSSNKALEKQLNIIVKGMLPETMEIKMKIMDVNFIKGVMSKYITGSEAGVKLGNEKVLYTAIVSAMYIRMNGKTYKQTGTANIHKEPKKSK